MYANKSIGIEIEIETKFPILSNRNGAKKLLEKDISNEKGMNSWEQLKTLKLKLFQFSTI